MKIVSFGVSLTLRLLLIGQSAFLLAFLLTGAMQFCSKETSALKLEASWGLMLTLFDLLTVPTMLIWRTCLDETPSDAMKHYRDKQREMAYKMRRERKAQEMD